MFWCLPPSGKCEWANLRQFADQFNDQHGLDYQLVKCLDVSDSSRPQPEVLLQATGQLTMVIERKAVVWPTNYFMYHRTEHEFRDFFLEHVQGKFPGDVYALTVQANSLRGNKTQIREFASSIASEVLNNRGAIFGGRRISKDVPIPWTFGRYPDYLRDEDVPPTGIGVNIVGEPWEELDADNYQIQLDGALKQLKKVLEPVPKKFDGYAGSLKIVVLEFYGDFLSEAEVKDLIVGVELPDVVDQVWLARPEWISSDDWEVAYDRIR